jgi:glycosyltransferase involved in cell wall biosynthesis
MRILFVAPWVPSAVRPRSLGLIRLLAEQHEVMFLGLARHDREARLVQDLPIVDGTIIANRRVGSTTRSIHALGRGVSLQSAYADVPELRVALRRLVREWSPDVVHLNVFRTAHLLHELADNRVVFDLDEFRSSYYAELAGTSSSALWRAVGRIEAPRMARSEARIRASHATLLVSAPGDVVAANTYLVRSPCDLEPARAVAVRPVILFVGRLHYRPNVEGLQWFCARCLPAIRAAHPDVTLRVVGESPPRQVRELAGDGVEVVADVSDVGPHYAESSVAIVPVATGTGVQMKLIQALAAGVPVVSFPGPLERAGIAAGAEALAAESPSEWTTAIGQLLIDGNLRTAFRQRGVSWVRAHHHSSEVRRALDEAYASAMATAAK